MRQTNVRGTLSLRGFRKLRTGAIVATGVILLGLDFLAPTVSASEQDGVWVARTVEEVKADIQNIDNLSHYTIKWGDTLSAISGATGLSVDSLVEINRIANRDLIFANNKLYFSEEAFLKDGNTEVKRQRVSIDNSGSCQSYEVETKTNTVTGEQTTTVKQTTPVVVETPAVSPALKAETPVTVAPKSDESATPALKTEEPSAPAPKVEEPATPSPKAEEPTTPAPKAEEPATPAPKTDEPATPAPKVEDPATPAPKSDEPVATTPKAEEPASTTPKADEPAAGTTPKAEESTAPAPKAEEATTTPAPKVEEPTTPAPKVEEPVTPAPKADESATPAPKADEPAASAPKADEPATPAPKAEEPAATTPKAEEPVSPAPKADEPAAPAPKADEPATPAPKVEEPATPAPKAEEPATPAPKVEEPATPAPKVEEPATPAPKVEEPATPAPKSEEPATPASEVEEPVSPALKAEEPAATTPKAEEPVSPVPKAEEPAAPAPKAEEPATPTPKVEEPATPAPKVEEPATPAPKVEEPATPAPKSEEPATPASEVEEPVSPTPKAEEPAVPAPKAEEPTTPAPKVEEPVSPVPKAEEPATPAPKAEESAVPAPKVGESVSPAPVTPSEEAPVTSGETNSTEHPSGESGKSETTSESSNTPSAEATNDSGNAATSTPTPEASTSEPKSEEELKKEEALKSAKKESIDDNIGEVVKIKADAIEKVTDADEKTRLKEALKALQDKAIEEINKAKDDEEVATVTEKYQNEINALDVPGEEVSSPNYGREGLTNNGPGGTTIDNGSTAIGHGASGTSRSAVASPTQPSSTSERGSSFRNAPSVQARARRVARSTSEPDGTVNISYNFAEMPDIHGFLSDPGEDNTVTIPAGTSEAQAKELVKEKIQAKIKDLAARGYYVKNDIIFEQDTTVKNYNYVVTFTKEATGTSGFRMAPAVQPRASRNRRSLEQPAPQKVKVNVFYNFDKMKDIAGFLGDINGTPLEIAEGSTDDQVKAAVKNQVDAKKEELRKRGYTVKEDYLYKNNGKDYNYVVTFTKETTGTSGFRMAPAVQPRASRNRRSLEQPAPQKVKVNVFYNFDQMKDIAGFLGDINGTSLEVAEGLSNEQVKAAVKSQVDAKKEELSKRGYTFKENYVYQSNGKDYNYVVTFSKAAK